MANTRLVYPCVVHDAFGSCSYDHDGKDHDYRSCALCWLCYGIRGFDNGHYRCVVKGDTRQTLWGLIGGLLFWTGWVEFLFQYYAHRFGVQPEIENGVVVTKPEYLILPASFGFWMMMMTMYIFSTRNGCNFITWDSETLFGKA